MTGTISRTQLFEKQGASASEYVADLFEEQARLLKEAGVDFFILETFFSVPEMLIALGCVRELGLPIVATMSFRPGVTATADGVSVADCARKLVDNGADVVGANCEQSPQHLLPILLEMRDAVEVPIAGQPAAFRTTNQMPCFTKMNEFPDDLETIQISRGEFLDSGTQQKRLVSITSAGVVVAMLPTSEHSGRV